MYNVLAEKFDPRDLVKFGFLKWSGDVIPMIGDDISPRFAPCKWEGGRVIGHFHRDGYLGLVIKVREGYTQEYKDANPSLITHLFGSEVRIGV